jgi:hypothetical protein
MAVQESVKLYILACMELTRLDQVSNRSDNYIRAYLTANLIAHGQSTGLSCDPVF